MFVYRTWNSTLETALSATPTRAAKAARKIIPPIQFILLVLACIVALPFLLGLFAAGFVWKWIDAI